MMRSSRRRAGGRASNRRQRRRLDSVCCANLQCACATSCMIPPVPFGVGCGSSFGDKRLTTSVRMRERRARGNGGQQRLQQIAAPRGKSESESKSKERLLKEMAAGVERAVRSEERRVG